MEVLDRERSASEAAHMAASDINGPPVLSSEIKAQQNVHGIGVFTAFEDGRVRVRFSDRTLVAVDRWHRCAEVLHRDSTRMTVSVRSCATLAVPLFVEFKH
jgi:hypothetical protein